MEINYHYYVTYTAAVNAGFSTGDAAVVARAAQFVDECYGETCQTNAQIFSSNLLDVVPKYQGEKRKLMEIWPVFHFLPGNKERVLFDADPGLTGSNKPMLAWTPGIICGTESHMTKVIVESARVFCGDASVTKQQKLLRVGITMHVLADTFAHQGFAGIPLSDVNEVSEVKTLRPAGGSDELRRKRFCPLEYSPAATSTSFGYLGHGRIGHLPDWPGCTFYYRAQWRKSEDPYIARCNPLEFYCAYLMMIEAMQYILGNVPVFSNQVDRALLLDAGRDQWPRTREYIDMFIAAEKDSRLKDPWFHLTRMAPPADYAAYSESREAPLLADFRAVAQAFRRCVFNNCNELQDYYNLYT